MMVKAKPSFENVSFRFTFWHKWGSVLHFESSIFGSNSFLTFLKNSKEQFFAFKKIFTKADFRKLLRIDYTKSNPNT